MALTFQDKVVIITGASNGVGHATANLFAEQGAKIAAFDIRDPPSTTSDSRIDIKVNVANEDEVIAAVKQVVDKWGTVDVLCNVAGIADNFARLTETTNDQLTRIMSVNFLGPFYLMKAVIPHFLAKPGSATGQGFQTQLPHKGAIVNVCSVAAVRGAAAGASYTASKHALLGLSRNTAWMYNRDGVRTNAVIPGGVATNIMGNSGYDPRGGSFDPIGAPLLAQSQGLMPAILQPADVASAVVYLAGAVGVNGAELSVDQGWTAA